MNSTIVITSFPDVNKARNQLVWLTFSCSRAKNYISEEPAQHAGSLTWLSCQKLQEINSPITSPPGPMPCGNPSKDESDVRTEQTEEMSAFGIARSRPELRACRGRPTPSWQCDLSWYPSAWIPVRRNTLTCPSNLQHLSFIFSSGNAAEPLQLYQS